MSFLDDLDDDDGTCHDCEMSHTVCEFSFCVICRDCPKAKKAREAAAAETRRVMSAPRSTLVAKMTQPKRVQVVE